MSLFLQRVSVCSVSLFRLTRDRPFSEVALSGRMVHPTCARILLHDTPGPVEGLNLVLEPLPMALMGSAGVVRPAWEHSGSGPITSSSGEGR